MVWYKLPFVIVLTATTLPWVAAYFDAKWITYIPISLALLAYFIYETNKRSRIFQSSPGFIFVFSIIFISVLWQLINGLGLGSGGTIIIFTLTFIYLNFFNSKNNGISTIDLTRQIFIIYALHVIFILFELCFRLTGFTDVIVSLVGNATEVNKYKMYNKAVFLQAIGFTDMTGLGGLLLGSQSASQVSLFAIFIFAPFYRANFFHKNYKTTYFWFIASIIAFLVSITMTASLIALILFFLLVFYLPNSKLRNVTFQLALISILVMLYIPISKLLFFNIKNQLDYLIYYESFYRSIDAFSNLNPIDQFFGLGKYADDVLSVKMGALGTISDFGIGALLNQAGILLMGVAVFLLIKIFIQVQRSVARLMKLSFNRTPWIWLATVNSLLTLGWGLSLIHYTPAVELGGRELFAFHLAVCLLAVKNMRQYSASVIPLGHGK